VPATRVLWLFLALMLPFASCTRPRLPVASREALALELMAADRAFAVATAQDGLDGWLQYFARGGAQVRSGGLATGHEAIREWMGPAFADSTFALIWEPHDADVAASGDLGYTFGRWESRRVGADGDRVRTGSYVTLWRRQPDGAWRVVLDIGSPDD
jgi:ketosteroid isomerase-like protein